MARVQFTFTFTNAQPGAEVNFGETGPVFSSASDTSEDGPRLVLDSTNTVTVWSDSATLTATTVDGRGEPISATATKTNPTVTTDSGTAGTSPFGSGTSSSLLSATKFAAISSFTPASPAVVAGAGAGSVDFTGATISKGATYWGPGTALDLDLTINGGGQLVLPDDDAVYDVDLGVDVACDAADDGKMVLVGVQSNDTGNAEVWVPVVAGVASAQFAGILYVFAGDGPTPMNVYVGGALLSVNAAITSVHQLHVTKR